MKMIAFDIDGTSINRFRNVTKVTLMTLEKLKESGLILVPTTGRCLNEIPDEFKNPQLCEYAITSNGAKIINLKTGELLYDNSVDVVEVLPLFAAVDMKNWMISIHRNHSVYDTHNTLRFARRIIFHKDLKVSERIKNISTFLCEEDTVEKIQLTSRSRQEMNRFVKLLQGFTQLEMPISRGRYIEITNQGVHKLSGVERLTQELGIALTDVLAIGDDMNDLELITHAGIGIAMENANDLVKAHADYVTKSNRENGFYHAMKHYFPDNIKF